MATSPNGWPVSSNAEELDITPLVIGGQTFAPGIRGGKVHEILSYVAEQVHKRVEPANAAQGCWGYSYRENVNSPGSWSNHASGTAIDYNASLHPNGVPTAQTWTPIQIAEIELILAEVNGAVRWGGHYSGTPDAMHFEINMTPDQLGEVAVEPGRPRPNLITTATGPMGAYRIADAEFIMEMQVSAPTPSLGSGNDYFAMWWKFRAAQTGRISMDALASYTFEGAVTEDCQVEVYTGPEGATSTEQLDYQTGGLQRFVDVEEGQLYYIAVVSYSSLPVMYHLKVGTYGYASEWIDPDLPIDIELVPVPSEDGESTNYSSREGLGTPWSGSYDAYATFNGTHGFMRSFGGPLPGDDMDAINCAWVHARRYTGGNQWWSKNNGPTWNGSGDRYDDTILGWGTCPTPFGRLESDYGVDGTIGYNFSSDDPTWVWNYQTVEFNTFAFANNLRVSDALTYFDTEVNQNLSVAEALIRDQGYNPGKANIWWDTDAPMELLEMWVMPDEHIASNPPEITGGGGSSGVIARWVASITEKDDGFTPRWGPKHNGWIGSYEGPEAFVGRSHLIADYWGGDAEWQQIPQYLIDRAIAYEKEDENYGGGLMFTCIPRRMMENSLPPELMITSGIGVWRYAYRYSQMLHVKYVVPMRPFRFEIPPEIPDFTPNTEYIGGDLDFYRRRFWAPNSATQVVSAN